MDNDEKDPKSFPSGVEGFVLEVIHDVAKELPGRLGFRLAAFVVVGGGVLLGFVIAKAIGQVDYWYVFSVGMIGLFLLVIYWKAADFSEEKTILIRGFIRLMLVVWLIVFLPLLLLAGYLYYDAQSAYEFKLKQQKEQKTLDQLVHETPEEAASTRALMEARAKGRVEFLKELERQKTESAKQRLNNSFE